MAKYKKVSTDLKFVDREKAIEKFWEDNHIFEKSMENRKEGETYTFYDGPPTANGKPHIGHVLTRVIKDMIPRYRTMKGYMVPRKAGWDTHGLPVELEVEKLLGLDGKDQIEEYGLEPFINKCKESVWKYKGMWEDFSGTVGFWADMEHPYVTYDNDFIESEWWALKQIWDKVLSYLSIKSDLLILLLLSCKSHILASQFPSVHNTLLVFYLFVPFLIPFSSIIFKTESSKSFSCSYSFLFSHITSFSLRNQVSCLFAKCLPTGPATP